MNSDPFPLDDPPRSNRTTAARPGYETAQFGRRLAASLQEMARYRDWVVYYDHGDTSVDATLPPQKDSSERR
jgi:hypothetical protein